MMVFPYDLEGLKLFQVRIVSENTSEPNLFSAPPNPHEQLVIPHPILVTVHVFPSSLFTQRRDFQVLTCLT